MRVFLAYCTFFFENYIRSHRYLREIILILVFHIFFWGFLYSERPEDAVWTVFATLGLILNLITTPSLFLLEKGNSIFFALVRQRGRVNYLLSKIFLIFTIDLSWVVLFSLIYGLRFMEGEYFLTWIPRILFIAFMMLLSVVLLSLFFTFRTWIIWLLMPWIIFGSILNKAALYPPDSWGDSYIILTLILPPFLEIIYSAVTLEISLWRGFFLFIAAIQITLYFWLNIKFVQNKDFH